MDTLRQWITHGPEETRCLGRRLGQCLQRGTILRLYGDLGSGKTCLVQGLARGLAVPAGYDITSPTYTLIHEYPGRLNLVHVDLYRLEGAMAADAVGLWDLCDDRSVVAVEWAERLPENEWPADSVVIQITTINDTQRQLRIRAPATVDIGGIDPAP